MNAPFDYFFEEQAPQPFNFEATAHAHGWVALRPFEWHEPAAELRRVHHLASGQVVRLRMQAADGSSNVQTQVEAVLPLTETDKAEISRAVRRMLRLDEDLSEFYRLRSQFDGWSLRLLPGSGRLLRCPSLFEDMIYTLCTTNIAWSGTIRMVDRLVTKLGHPFPAQEAWRAFPTPAAIAAAGPEFLKQETGLGYRSVYAWELATAVAEDRLDLEQFEAPGYPPEALYRDLRRIKGIGNYAAATILMLLGRYEQLAIDSEARAFVSRKYLAGQAATDAQIRAIYEPWGRWQYLAYWFDLIGEA
jgi:3-methyladenine DNA glycosylase/8-oxoguanine DNA glycosylase